MTPADKIAESWEHLIAGIASVAMELGRGEAAAAMAEVLNLARELRKATEERETELAGACSKAEAVLAVASDIGLLDTLSNTIHPDVIGNALYAVAKGARRG